MLNWTNNITIKIIFIVDKIKNNWISKTLTFLQQVPPWTWDTRQHEVHRQQGCAHQLSDTPKHQALDEQQEQQMVVTLQLPTHYKPRKNLRKLLTNSTKYRFIATQKVLINNKSVTWVDLKTSPKAPLTSFCLFSSGISSNSAMTWWCCRIPFPFASILLTPWDFEC